MVENLAGHTCMQKSVWVFMYSDLVVVVVVVVVVVRL
jgi:hypothetical protein